MKKISQDRDRTNSRITYAATTEDLKIAEEALRRLRVKSKKIFAESIQISRTTIAKFFGGKPIKLDDFQTICNELKLLDWKEIAGIERCESNKNVEQEPIFCLQTIEEKKVSMAITTSISQKNLLKYKSINKILQKIANDNFIEVVNLEKGSIKLTLKGSSAGLKKLEQLFKSGILTEIFQKKLNITVEDVSFIDAQASKSHQKNQNQKLLAFTITGNVNQTDIAFLKAALVETTDSEKIKNKEKSCLIREIRTQKTVKQKLKGADLSNTNLSDANLKGTDLRGTDLNGADLRGAYLRSADLSDTKLRGARLRGSSLSGADLSGADLSDADLSGADLNGVKINDRTKLDEKWRKVWEIVNQPEANRILIGADLSSANLSSTNLSGANLINTNLINADLSSADLSGADLSGAEINDRTKLDEKWRKVWEIVNQTEANRTLSGADLSSANLSGADLSDADLSYANLSGADLSGADLSAANLISADLSGADLSYANLSGADLSAANLISADLSGADLINANLSGTDLSGANVQNSDFTYSAGISETLKKDLKARGAIFEDFPGKDSKILIQV